MSRIVVTLVVIVVLVLVVVQLVRSTPAPALTMDVPASHSLPGGPPSLPWPSMGTATVAVEGAGTMGSYGGDQQYAIASLTKMMTALVILDDHPLTLGESGPSITITQADVQQYLTDKSEGDSVVAVTPGEKITELQALEGALIPSGDNMAELLADWDAGSVPAFVTRMDQRAQALGLHHTHYADASGVNPATVSTARDQLKVAEAAMANPVFAGIVSMAQVTLPVAGVQPNVNADLGKNGIVGVKTGWVPAGGGSFVFAAQHTVDAHKVTVIGAVLGQQGVTPLPTALSVGSSLATAAAGAVQVDQVLAKGTTVATITAPYSSSVPLVAASGATLVAWPGATVTETLHLTRKVAAPIVKGSPMGNLVVSIGSEQASVPVVAEGSLSGASLTWKLTRT
jgi:D-alanyl-D-alanine carboxypeptidase (penicillin-binding protein 5/6)